MDGDGTWGVPDEGVTCVEGELGVEGKEEVGFMVLVGETEG